MLLFDKIKRSEVLAMSELGTTIKKYRKDKKMTLAELAGDRLTKGMLSLIENGKAQPSMDSLHYIAERLEVDVAQLMGESNIEQLRDLLVEVEEQLVNLNQLYVEDEQEIMMQKIYEKIKPYEHMLRGNTYEAVRLQDIFARLQTHLFNIFEEDTWYEIIALYEKLYNYNRVIRTYSFLAWHLFEQQDYLGGIKIFEQSEEIMKKYIFLIDDVIKLDLYYNLTVSHAAVNNQDQAKKYIDQAFAISKAKKLYYRLDDFYRFLFMLGIEKNDKETCAYYLRKLQLHAEFSEEMMAESASVMLKIYYVAMIEKDYEKAENLYQNFLTTTKLPSNIISSPFFDCIRAYCFWNREMFNDALEVINNLAVPDYLKHPLDLSIFYQGFAVRALCHKELGDLEAAKRDILYAENGVKNFPQSIYTNFIKEAFESIMK